MHHKVVVYLYVCFVCTHVHGFGVLEFSIEKQLFESSKPRWAKYFIWIDIRKKSASWQLLSQIEITIYILNLSFLQIEIPYLHVDISGSN